MKGYHANIDEVTIKNSDFRHVLYTGQHSQLVAMSLMPGQDIGLEVHPDNDQFFRIEQGQGQCIIDGHSYIIAADDAIIVPAGAEHNIINTSTDQPLKLYTIYSPAHHKDGTIRDTKEQALADEPQFDGRTTE